MFSRSGLPPHSDQESDCAVRTDAYRQEQLWGVTFDEHAQRHAGGPGYRVLVSPTIGGLRVAVSVLDRPAALFPDGAAGGGPVRYASGSPAF